MSEEELYQLIMKLQSCSGSLPQQEKDLYVYHPGSGTYLALSECILAKLEDIPEAQE